MTAAAFLISQDFQFAHGESPLSAGLHVLPWTATPVFLVPLAGMISDRIGRRPLMLAGTSIQGVGLLSFAALTGAEFSYWPAVLTLVVAGIGVSITLPATSATVMNSVEAGDLGKASAVNSVMQPFGTAFGVALATAVFASNGSLTSGSRLHGRISAGARCRRHAFVYRNRCRGRGRRSGKGGSPGAGNCDQPDSCLTPTLRPIPPGRPTSCRPGGTARNSRNPRKDGG